MKTIITLKHRKIKFLLLFAVIFGIIAVSCRKPEIDYREKWVGVYECEEGYQWWMGAGDKFTSGEEVYQIKLTVITKGDSILKLSENRNGDSYEIKIESDGGFNEKGENSDIIKGNFYGDSINIFILHSFSSGSGSSSNYKGKKT